MLFLIMKLVVVDHEDVVESSYIYQKYKSVRIKYNNPLVIDPCYFLSK